MRIVEHIVKCKSRRDIYRIYPFGDVHLGKVNCSEGSFKRWIKMVEEDDNAIVIGNGDYCDCIKPSDIKRFNVKALADWLFMGEPDTIKDGLSDILKQQRNRIVDFLEPISDKIIGLGSGNHEANIEKYHNESHHQMVCDMLDVEDLTDCCFIRIKFKRKRGKAISNLIYFQAHGYGGGRTAGSEPRKLAKFIADKECDIAISSHTHTFHILPPQVKLTVPRKGKLPSGDCINTTTRAMNPGCFVKTYATGPATYDSRGCYPARPLVTGVFEIKPFCEHDSIVKPKITVREVRL